MSKYSSRNYTYREALDALAQLDKDNQQLRRQNRALNDLTRERREEKDSANKEVKKLRGNIIHMTRRQKAKDEMNKAGAWSGGAAVTVALFYELCKASDGWIGGPAFQSFWQHEAMISTLTFLVTALFGWAYKSLHPDSK
jgi:chromosome segregation ATPase